MKTLLMFNLQRRISLVKIVGLIALLAACTENEITPSRQNNGSLATEDLQNPSGAEESGGIKGFNKNSHPNGQNFNLNVWLLGDEHGEAGFIAFRQKQNETQLVHLDTRLMGLEPNTSYILQRAVDTTLDGNCTSTSWLTLGKGLEPQSIVTDQHGFGREDLFRSVSTVPVGSSFDIHFQILKESTMEVVLTSDCFDYTVR